MFSGTNAPSLADIAAVTGNNNNGWNNGDWEWILLFALFGWGNGGFFGNNGNGQCATNEQLQGRFDTQSILNKLDGVTSQIDSLGYDQLSRMDNINQNIMQNAYSVQNMMNQNNLSVVQGINGVNQNLAAYNFAVQQGQSDIRYNMATDTCAIQNALNQAVQTIMQNDNANYRALHDENVESEMNRLKDIIAQQNNQIGNLNLANQLAAQREAIVNDVRPTPDPAYIVSNPWSGCGCTGYNGCCGN